MATVNLNATQKAAVKQLKGVPYAVIKTSTAHALIVKGVARQVVVQPEPLHGMAIRLTGLGQSL